MAPFCSSPDGPLPFFRCRFATGNSLRPVVAAPSLCSADAGVLSPSGFSSILDIFLTLPRPPLRPIPRPRDYNHSSASHRYQAVASPETIVAPPSCLFVFHSRSFFVLLTPPDFWILAPDSSFLNSYWKLSSFVIPYLSIRFRKVARVTPSNFAAFT